MKSSGIGGQAVIEGIMMKNGDTFSIAVRKPDGEIDVQVDAYSSIAGKSVLRNTLFPYTTLFRSYPLSAG